MQLSEFDYSLPEELIAKHPTPERTGSRLLVLNKSTGGLEDRQFVDLVEYLTDKDLLVFNNTRVVPARLYGAKETGGQVEILIERVLSGSEAIAHIKASKAPKPGSKIILDRGYELEVTGRSEALFNIQSRGDLSVILNEIGHMPLPPYIQREDSQEDKERYQTVYGKVEGAVAAPTAGLHFDSAYFRRLTEKGVRTAEVTLHVGAGTFQPVRVDCIQDHKMHAEWVEVSEEVCQKIEDTRSLGGKVIAVGTTSVRCLETAQGKPYTGDTRIFIYPGYRFNTVDAMVTNFHLPRSTLLMLVSAFAGKSNIIQAYQHAIQARYRFFSYGDAMLIL